MSNKYYMLGKFKALKESELTLDVRRNFRDHDGGYTHHLINITVGVGVSEILMSSLEKNEIIHVQGRIELCENSNLRLIAEHVAKIASLS